MIKFLKFIDLQVTIITTKIVYADVTDDEVENGHIRISSEVPLSQPYIGVSAKIDIETNGILLDVGDILMDNNKIKYNVVWTDLERERATVITLSQVERVGVFVAPNKFCIISKPFKEGNV